MSAFPIEGNRKRFPSIGSRLGVHLARWDLVADGEPIETPSSLLLAVRHNGRPAMLKIAREEEERQREIEERRRREELERTRERDARISALTAQAEQLALRDDFDAADRTSRATMQPTLLNFIATRCLA